MRYALGLALGLALPGIGAAAENAGQAPAAAQPPLKVCMLSGSSEYKSDESLAAFKALLESKYNAACTLLIAKDGSDMIGGLDALDACDVLLVFTRRLKLPPDQIDRIKKYCQAGKPVVGLRTASHAFQTWLEFDKEVLGGDYKGHFGKGPVTQAAVAEKGKGHPILAGVKAFTSPATLYKNPDVARDVDVLLTGTTSDGTHPLAWTRLHNGGRVFYTSLGAPEDFANEDFRTMLVNAVFWAAKRGVEAKAATSAPAAK
jgi:type 1 glutamine amidotransferase